MKRSWDINTVNLKVTLKVNLRVNLRVNYSAYLGSLPAVKSPSKLLLCGAWHTAVRRSLEKPPRSPTVRTSMTSMTSMTLLFWTQLKVLRSKHFKTVVDSRLLSHISRGMCKYVWRSKSKLHFVAYTIFYILHIICHHISSYHNNRSIWIR